MVTLQHILVMSGCGHIATYPCCGWVWSLQHVLIQSFSSQLGLDWGSTVESFKAFLLEAISEYQVNIDAMNAVFLEGGCGSGCGSG